MKRLALVLGGMAVVGGGIYFLPSRETAPASEPASTAPAVAAAVAAAPAVASARSPASAPSGMATSGIKATLACLESGTCDFPQTDSRSYEFAVGRRLAAQLSELHSSAGPEAAEEIARELMKVDDGFVQEQAIKVFSALPPSRQNVESMVGALALSHDPLIIEQAMKEWERYIGTPEEATVQEFLADFIAHGGQFTSEKASSLVLKFLNERTESAFRSALASMIPESTAARNLRSALAEYERQVSGG